MTKEEKREYYKQWYIANREKILEQHKEYYTANREKRLKQQKEYNKEYYKTPMGRASNLLNAYNRNDKKYNRGEGDLTAQWIADNILSKPCVHCGESDWKKIGCNRIDNSKPHTKDNVEPCCCECNKRLAIEDEAAFKDQKKRVYQYSLDGELVKVWESSSEAGRNGFNQGNISQCCLGKRYKTHGGYRWSYQPL